MILHTSMLEKKGGGILSGLKFKFCNWPPCGACQFLSHVWFAASLTSVTYVRTAVETGSQTAKGLNEWAPSIDRESYCAAAQSVV